MKTTSQKNDIMEALVGTIIQIGNYRISRCLWLFFSQDIRAAQEDNGCMALQRTRNACKSLLIGQ